MSVFVLPLDSPEATIELAGGKGAGLAALIRAGFRVPPGYIVTTAAYRAFVSGAKLESEVARCGAAPDANAGNAASALQALLKTAPVPEHLVYAITEAYARLADHLRAAGQLPPDGALPVAVRSSATTEDMPHASFAGQHETFLNVRGEAALLDAVRGCWSGLWTERAIAYRRRLGIPADRVSLAVVVQWLLNAERSGVLFTLDPVSGDRGVVVINAAWGLGDAVVAGRVVPDAIVVEKESGRVLRRQVANKRVMTVTGDGGVVDVPVEPEHRPSPVLDDAEAAALAQLGAEVEQLYNGAQDVEWASVGRSFYLLQARPVTAAGVGAVDDQWPALEYREPQPFDRWTLANVGELWPEPVSPLVASVIPLVIGGAVRSSFRGVDPDYLDRIQWAKRFYGRIYYNEGALKHVLSQKLGLPASLFDRSRGNRTRTPDGGGVRPLTLLANLRTVIRLATRQQHTGKKTEEFIVNVDRWVADFLRHEAFPSSDLELWKQGQVWLERTRLGMNLQNEMTGLALAALGTLESLLVRWFDRADLTADLVAGLADIQAAEMGARLWRLAESLRATSFAAAELENDPAGSLRRLRTEATAEPALRRLEEFLAEHGHRCANEAEWLHPRWHEAPEQVLVIAAAYLRPGTENPWERTQRQRRRREAAVDWVDSHLGWLQRILFHRVLARAQHGLRLRDNGKSAAIKVAFPSRRISAVLGERWAQRGWLARSDDIFFVSYPEIDRVIAAGSTEAAALDLRALVAERRRSLAHWRTVRVPEVLGPHGEPLEEAAQASDGALELHGIGASSGRVRGIARVVLNPADALRLGSSEILITRATDAGWSAAFPLIGGLITEIGGQLSHAAIVAREYGLPAVVNVIGATTLIRDGQSILLDGGTGTVWLEASVPDARPREDGR